MRNLKLRDKILLSILFVICLFLFKNINEVIKNEVHFDSPSDISLENAEKLEQMFREELDKADIDPNNMCFDKYPDAQEGPYKRARSYNNSE